LIAARTPFAQLSTEIYVRIYVTVGCECSEGLGQLYEWSAPEDDFKTFLIAPGALIPGFQQFAA
jgi:hypothetical protein